jgi:glyoxylase-like metal-dependent hydrolase (beta-lactamase superfamily II)
MYTLQLQPSLYRMVVPYENGGIVYLYLIKGDQTALVDTGTASSPLKVLPAALAGIGMSLADIDLILCTHGHLDHAGGNTGVKTAAPMSKIHMHPADLPLCQDLAAEIEFHLSPLRALDFPDSFVKARREYIALAAGAEKVPVDVLMAGGDVIDLGKGIKLSVIHAPGHTPGHVVFFWQSEGILLVGDAVQGQGGKPGGYPYYFDAANQRRSLDIMSRLDCRMLCLGHASGGGGPISDPTRTGEEVGGLLKESMRVSDAIQSAVTSAVKQMPGANHREIALAALAELVYELPQQRLRETQMPVSAGPTIYGHIQAALDGSYPV